MALQLPLQLQFRADPDKIPAPARSGLGLLGAILAAATLWIAAAQRVALASPIDEAQALLDAGQPVAALRLLDPLERDRAGDPRYDYLLAIAALDSGKPARASAVFERILSLAPRLAGIRVELAHALRLTGQAERARSEIAAVLATPDLPPQLRAAAQNIAAEITHTDATALSLPDEDGEPRASTPIVLSANSLASQPGARLNAMISEGVSAQGAIQGANDGLRWRFDTTATQLIQAGRHIKYFDSGVGLSIDQGGMGFGGGIRAGQVVLDGSLVSSSAGLSADWHHQPAPRAQLSLKIFANRHWNPRPGSNGQGVDVNGLAATWSFSDPHQRNPFSMQLMSERQTSSTGSAARVAHLSTLNARWQARLDARLDMVTSLSAQLMGSGYPNEGTGRRATGKTIEAGIGLDWRYAKDWSLQPTLIWASADGIASLRAPTGTELSVMLRGRF